MQHWLVLCTSKKSKANKKQQHKNKHQSSERNYLMKRFPLLKKKKLKKLKKNVCDETDVYGSIAKYCNNYCMLLSLKHNKSIKGLNYRRLYGTNLLLQATFIYIIKSLSRALLRLYILYLCLFTCLSVTLSQQVYIKVTCVPSNNLYYHVYTLYCKY